MGGVAALAYAQHLHSYVLAEVHAGTKDWGQVPGANTIRCNWSTFHARLFFCMGLENVSFSWD